MSTKCATLRKTQSTAYTTADHATIVGAYDAAKWPANEAAYFPAIIATDWRTIIATVDAAQQPTKFTSNKRALSIPVHSSNHTTIIKPYYATFVPTIVKTNHATYITAVHATLKSTDLETNHAALIPAIHAAFRPTYSPTQWSTYQSAICK